MLDFINILTAAVFIQVASMAAVGRMMGVTIRAVSLGVGPIIFRSSIISIGSIPTGGHVSFRDSRHEPVPAEEMKTALDGRSALEQLVVSLSGCVGLFVAGVLAVGADGADALLRFPVQFFAGAISPFDEARSLLRSGEAFTQSAPFGALFGIVCAKLAAFNLLPFPGTNGGAAIAILGRLLGADRWWPAFATRLLALIYLACLASWCFALLAYVSAH